MRIAQETIKKQSTKKCRQVVTKTDVLQGTVVANHHMSKDPTSLRLHLREKGNLNYALFALFIRK